ncbi:MAG: ribose 5-phosphate isomerase B [Candidatus Tectomicrobia bacterium]|uniref:Ribose 5-phosphate isomerase B n=1 Tax=Tectimicrobiota bacterium TaxID=2528274 RepID=A0A932LZ16_UNCTE|nr:ribose 5-phosphate isomerase B [Candidatus Tectomicrobia bacterium]
MDGEQDQKRGLEVAIAADHAGYPLKEDLKNFLKNKGYTPIDLGTHSADPVDYPDFADPLARGISNGDYERGILICGTGIGMSMTANRFPGVRAALVQDAETARLSREHNDANVLVLGGRVTPFESAREILEVWLATEFAGGRHERRIQKMERLNGN